ncbi:sodium-translocating pyrophosphatase, partial [Candidatus Falkowbacteria bacterium CG10_big_fil_rev_8_21_14_0_10_39_9]
MKTCLKLMAIVAVFLIPTKTWASEADLKIPELTGNQISLLMWGFAICVAGIIFALYQYRKVKKIPAHKSMLGVAEIIFATCKTYLKQQGKFLILFFVIIGSCIGFYFGGLQDIPWSGVALILGWTVIGILGSYSVAWFGIRMNTLANSRMAFASLKKQPIRLLN